MKLLVYEWNSLCDDIVVMNLREMGHEVVEYNRKCEHYTRDLKLANELINIIHDESIEAVFSFNYIPIISMVCNTVKINYYSWVFDSPHLTLYAKTIIYPCNRIGCFDKDDVRRLTDIGINTVKYLPLAGDARLFKTNDKSYSSDISFVGNLYTDEHNYYDFIEVNTSIKQRMEETVEKQQFNYECDFISDFWNKGNQNELLEYVYTVLSNNNLLLGEDEYFEDIIYLFNTTILEKKVTVEERRKLLMEVAGLGYDFRLYTGSKTQNNNILEAVNCGYIDYGTQMPSVFANSRINLNITLRSIHSGVPLRVMDIMACGGFVLSNYQEELVELFEENKEIVVFRSLEDCIEKIHYYLSHEDERAAIARAGKRAVDKRFNYYLGLDKLFTY